MTSPLRFGSTNSVPDSTLTVTPTVSTGTNLDSLKNEWRARQVIWDDPATDIVITGTLTETAIGEYLSLPNSNLTEGSTVQLELFETSTAGTDLLDMDAVGITSLIPLGEWRAGIDEYGNSYDRNPDGFTMWFAEPIQYKVWRLTISNDATAQAALDDVRLRMVLIGEKVQLENNFSFGGKISFLSDPTLTVTTSGSNIPTRTQRKSRYMELALDMMNVGDRRKIWRLETDLLGGYFLVSAYPEAGGFKQENYTFLGRFSSGLKYIHTHDNIHAVSHLGIIEV
ncbi:MAG: hypothetical protein GY941_19800 [Planctomycetes bacterium]|nr:hypothetical protein [Planctomycetota bacterium]